MDMALEKISHLVDLVEMETQWPYQAWTRHQRFLHNDFAILEDKMYNFGNNPNFFQFDRFVASILDKHIHST